MDTKSTQAAPVPQFTGGPDVAMSDAPATAQTQSSGAQTQGAAAQTQGAAAQTQGAAAQTQGAAGAQTPGSAPAAALSMAMQELETRVIETMMSVYDPEIPVNIYELGMVYEVDVKDPGDVFVKMTLTSPACPVAGSLPGEVEAKVRSVDGVLSAKLELVWEPPWNPSMMSDAAKLQLGMF